MFLGLCCLGTKISSRKLEKTILLVPVRTPGIVEMITAGFPRYPQPLQVSRISVHDLRARLDHLRVAMQAPVHAERASETGTCVCRIHGLESLLLRIVTCDNNVILSFESLFPRLLLLNSVSVPFRKRNLG